MHAASNKMARKWIGWRKCLYTETSWEISLEALGAEMEVRSEMSKESWRPSRRISGRHPDIESELDKDIRKAHFPACLGF
jgi:hypothetical protein